MFRYILSSFLILLLLNAPVFAAEINDEGAKHLEALFSGLIDHRTKSLLSEGITLETEGKITIEQADAYYAVTLPSIILHSAKGRKVKIGLVAINVTPTSTPDNWKMSVALPTPILYSDKKGELALRIDIGAQRMGGIWSEKLEGFSKLTARYNNIKLSHYEKQEVTSIEQLDITKNFDEIKEDYWSGPTKITLSNFNIGSKSLPRMLAFREGKINFSVEGFSPASQLKEESENNIDTFIMLFKNIGHSTSMQGIISDLQINIPPKNHKPPRSIRLNSGSFSMNMTGMKERIINQSLQLGYRGFSTSNNLTYYQSLLPTDFNINVALDRLPLQDILTFGSKAIDANTKNSGAGQVALLQAMMTLPQILTETGTTLTLTNTSYGNNTYNVAMNGAVKPNLNSPFGATGNLTVKMTGLQDVISTLEQHAVKSTPEARQEIEKTLQKLRLLDKISTTEGEEKICKLILNEQAAFSVNGQDINALMNGAPLQ